MLQIEKPPKKCPVCKSESVEAVTDRAYGTNKCLECNTIWEAGRIEKECEDLICPICRSTNTVEMLNHAGDPSGNCLCRACSCQFSLRSDTQTSEVGGLIVVCPHCAALDSIEEYAGEEWCAECNIDPNDIDVPSSSIGHLYKGAARRLLLKDRPIVGKDRIYGRFLRNECGPHCTFGEACPQSVSNLRMCAQEEDEEFDEVFEHQESGAMSKRRRGKKNRGKQGHKSHTKKRRGSRKAGPAKVAFFCAKGGLLEKLYGAKTTNTERSGGDGAEP